MTGMIAGRRGIAKPGSIQRLDPFDIVRERNAKRSNDPFEDRFLRDALRDSEARARQGRRIDPL